MKFEVSLLKQVVMLLVRGVASETSEVQSDSTNCINAFCEFVHEKLKRKPTQKSAYLVQCVTRFYNESFDSFEEFLKAIIF